MRSADLCVLARRFAQDGNKQMAIPAQAFGLGECLERFLFVAINTRRSVVVLKKQQPFLPRHIGRMAIGIRVLL